MKNVSPMIRVGRLRYSIVFIPRRMSSANGCRMDRARMVLLSAEWGRPTNELAQAQEFQRKAQFFLDYVEAENSTGFHAPQEAARILGQAIDLARQGQLLLRDKTGP